MHVWFHCSAAARCMRVCFVQHFMPLVSAGSRNNSRHRMLQACWAHTGCSVAGHCATNTNKLLQREAMLEAAWGFDRGGFCVVPSAFTCSGCISGWLEWCSHTALLRTVAARLMIVAGAWYRHCGVAVCGQTTCYHVSLTRVDQCGVGLTRVKQPVTMLICCYAAAPMVVAAEQKRFQRLHWFVTVHR